MAMFDLGTTYQKRKALLAIFGIMIMLPTAFVGTWLFAVVVAPNLALYGGLSAVTLMGGILGFAVVLSEHVIQEVKIKVIEEKK